MSPVVVIAPEDLRELVAAGVAEGVKRALAASAAANAAPACDWIGVDEALAIVGCSRDHLRKIPRDVLPRHGTSRKPRYRRSEVEAYVERRSSATE